MSESTGPKTWGDVIQFCPDDSNGEIPEFSGTQTRVEWVAYVISRRGIDAAIEETCLSKESIRLVLRWLLADRPPLTASIPPEVNEPANLSWRQEWARAHLADMDAKIKEFHRIDEGIQRPAMSEPISPIPPETPEPVALAVRWEPTKEDAERIIDECNRVADDMNDCREEATVLIDAIRDCQRDLPAVEPPTPPTDRIAEEPQGNEEITKNSLMQNLYSSIKTISDRIADLEWSAPIHRDKIERIEFRIKEAETFRENSLGWTVDQNRLNEATDRRLAALESRVITPAPEPRDAVAVSVDGWQTEPPTVDCPCWVEVHGGMVFPIAWDVNLAWGIDQHRVKWKAHEIKRYFPCPKPSPNPIGRSAYNTPTTFEQALTVETQVAPEPERPLPEGCAEIEGFPLLCLSRKGNVRPRSRECFFLTWSDGHAAWMKACGCSQDEIKQAARYAIGQIARDAGLDVVVK